MGRLNIIMGSSSMDIEKCKECYKEHGQTWDNHADTDDFERGYVWCPIRFKRMTGERLLTRSWRSMKSLWRLRYGIPGWCKQSGLFVVWDERMEGGCDDCNVCLDD